MRAFEMMRQVYIHINGGNRFLAGLGFIPYRYGIGDRFDAYLLYIDPSMIYLTLYILHRYC